MRKIKKKKKNILVGVHFLKGTSHARLIYFPFSKMNLEKLTHDIFSYV